MRMLSGTPRWSVSSVMRDGLRGHAAAHRRPTTIAEAKIDRWDPAMDAIVPKDWKIEKLAEGFGWAEGPIWVKSGGYLLFTDVPGNKMWKWSEKGGLEKFLDPSGAANPDTNDLARSRRQRPRHPRQEHHPARRHRQPRHPEAGPQDEEEDARGDELRRQEVREPQRRHAHEERRAVLHRSAVRLQEVRRRAARWKSSSTASIAWARTARSPPSRRSCIARTASRSRPTSARCTSRSPSRPRRSSMAYSLDADGNVTGKKLFHDVTDLVAKDAPGLPDGLTVASRRHDLHERPRRHPRALEGRQASRPHQRRQAHGQLQVRRRRQDAVPDLAEHAGAHPAERQRRGFLKPTAE